MAELLNVLQRIQADLSNTISSLQNLLFLGTFKINDGAICYSILYEENVFTALQQIQQILNGYNIHNSKPEFNEAIPAKSLSENPFTNSNPHAMKREFPDNVPDTCPVIFHQSPLLNIAEANKAPLNNDGAEITLDKVTPFTDNVPGDRKDVNEITNEWTENKAVFGSSPVALLGEEQTDIKVEGETAEHKVFTAVTNKENELLEDAKSNINIRKGPQKFGNTKKKKRVHFSGKNCTKCNKVFPSNKDYRKHYTGVHKVKICQKCQKVLKGSEQIKRHKEVHRKETKAAKPLEYICHTCGCKYANKGLLHRHMYKEHNYLAPGIFHCAKCKLTFELKIGLEEHLQCCSKSEFECQNCKETFTDYLSFQKHKAEEKSRTVCNLCGWTTMQSSHLRRHLLLVHKQVQEGGQHCEICRIAFVQKKSFDKHMELHRNSNFKCNSCSETFSDAKKLRKHKDKMHSRRFCPKCPMVFKRELEVKKHLALEHGGHSYSCSQCDYVAYSMSVMRIHEKTHLSKGAFQCKHCGRHMKSEQNLRCHEMKHEGVLPFSCSVCDRSFTTKRSLTYHLQSHNRQGKMFPCTKCERKYQTESGLKHHLKSHENLRDWKCRFCEKGFNDKQNLVKHERVHTGERPFTCSVCGDTFKQSGALYTHNKLKHGGKKTDEGSNNNMEQPK